MTLEHEDRDREHKPIPDPTSLTTQQLLREINNTEALLDSKITALNDKLETRLLGMDKALQLLQSTTDKVGNEADVKVAHLKALHDERFLSVDQQFKERDIRDAGVQTASKEAINAALQAAKEAVGKTEVSFTKSIDQLNEQIRLTSSALDSKINAAKESLEGKIAANKERVDRIEGSNNGISSSWGVAATFIMVGLIVASIIIGVTVGK